MRWLGPQGGNDCPRRCLGNHTVDDVCRLDYAKISRKLAGARDWCGTRYYIGRVPQAGNRRLYADQRRFLAKLAAIDGRITCHLGWFERRRLGAVGAR